MINLDNTVDSVFPYLSTISGDSDELSFIKRIELLYSRFDDEISKKIFLERLLLSFTEKTIHIRRLSELTCTGAAFCKKVNQLSRSNNMIYIYGCGKRGKRLVDMFPDIQFAGFIDRKAGNKYKDIPVLGIDEAPTTDECIIVISNLYGSDGIVDDLLSLGIKEDSFIVLTEYEKTIQNEIYFEDRCIKGFKSSDGAFIDGGSLDGNDSRRFINSNLYNGNAIIAFEPDSTSFINTTENLKNLDNVTVYQRGLSDKKTRVHFDGGKGEAASISEQGTDYIETVRLDDICESINVSFIKLDIEGSEYAAITGAQNVILRDKPNLMVSVYHKKEDILSIPLLLLKYNENYKFALGHYSVGSATDTVLYAFDRT